MERVLKDDAIQEKGERARMVTTRLPSDLLVFLLGLTGSVRSFLRWFDGAAATVCN